MNFALLLQANNLSTYPVETLIEQTKEAVRADKFRNQIEMAFYLSAKEPQEFYILALCYQNQDLDTALAVIQRVLSSSQQTTGAILQQYTFKMNWDYRLLHLNPSASHLQLITFPEDYSILELEKLISFSKQHLRKMPEIIGAWLGCSISGKAQLLNRVDWSSGIALLEYVGSQVLQEHKVQRRSEALSSEYASFNFYGSVQSGREIA